MNVNSVFFFFFSLIGIPKKRRPTVVLSSPCVFWLECFAVILQFAEQNWILLIWQFTSRCTVILRWRLHFEFVTAREPMEPPTVLQNQSEVTVWAGAEHVDVDTFSWDLPIKVLPTNPALASYVSQFTGSNSINIWLCEVLWSSYSVPFFGQLTFMSVLVL